MKALRPLKNPKSIIARIAKIAETDPDWSQGNYYVMNNMEFVWRWLTDIAPTHCRVVKGREYGCKKGPFTTSNLAVTSELWEAVRPNIREFASLNYALCIVNAYDLPLCTKPKSPTNYEQPHN